MYLPGRFGSLTCSCRTRAPVRHHAGVPGSELFLPTAEQRLLNNQTPAHPHVVPGLPKNGELFFYIYTFFFHEISR